MNEQEQLSEIYERAKQAPPSRSFALHGQEANLEQRFRVMAAAEGFTPEQIDDYLSLA